MGEMGERGERGERGGFTELWWAEFLFQGDVCEVSSRAVQVVFFLPSSWVQFFFLGL